MIREEFTSIDKHHLRHFPDPKDRETGIKSLCWAEK
jgi:hypothetical protein